jgi:hypothetical protein
MNYIFEISNTVNPTLLEIDKLFDELKSEKIISKHLVILRKIELKLKSIFNYDFKLSIDYTVDTFNVAMIPDFKLESYNNVLRNTSEIQLINIIIGIDVIWAFNPREITSVVLHEIGHVENRLTGTLHTLRAFFQKHIYKIPIISLIPIIGGLISLLMLRGFYFTNHKAERLADKYVVKYGYGDELIKVMAKFQFWNKNAKRDESGIISKIFNLLENNLLKTHPDDKTRIKQIYNTIIDNYADQYNSKQIKKILNKYKVSL